MVSCAWVSRCWSAAGVRRSSARVWYIVHPSYEWSGLLQLALLRSGGRHQVRPIIGVEVADRLLRRRVWPRATSRLFTQTLAFGWGTAGIPSCHANHDASEDLPTPSAPSIAIKSGNRFGVRACLVRWSNSAERGIVNFIGSLSPCRHCDRAHRRSSSDCPSSSRGWWPGPSARGQRWVKIKPFAGTSRSENARFCCPKGLRQQTDDLSSASGMRTRLNEAGHNHGGKSRGKHTWLW